MVPAFSMPPGAFRRAFRRGASSSLVVLVCALLPVSAFSQADSTAAAGAGAREAGGSAPPRMVITTEKRGNIVIELYPEHAPKTVERITSLVRAAFYDGLPFHRVETYVIQTGSAESDLPRLEGEMFSQKLTHEAGMVGMARFPDDYDSAKTQFYICKKHLPLMNKEYTLFGKVIEGIEIVHRIKKGDKIKSIVIVP